MAGSFWKKNNGYVQELAGVFPTHQARCCSASSKGAVNACHLWQLGHFYLGTLQTGKMKHLWVYGVSVCLCCPSSKICGQCFPAPQWCPEALLVDRETERQKTRVWDHRVTYFVNSKERTRWLRMCSRNFGIPVWEAVELIVTHVIKMILMLNASWWKLR